MRDHKQSLISRGYAPPGLFELIDDVWDTYNAPISILSFQLPYQLHVQNEKFLVDGKRVGTKISFHFYPITCVVSDNFSFHTYLNDSNSSFALNGNKKKFDCTHVLAVTQLWGTRQAYFANYEMLVQRRALNEILIQSVNNPYDHIPGSISGDRFEADIANRSLIEVRHAIRRFLKDYMIVTLDEVERPDQLLSLFAITNLERIFPFGSMPGLAFGLLRYRTSHPIKLATAAEIVSASKWPIRDFAAFELQLFALKRLADQGEPGLALTGLVALLEWFLKDKMPEGQRKKRMRLVEIIDHPAFDFLPPEIKQGLHAARRIRNKAAHERPTEKADSDVPTVESMSKHSLDLPHGESVMAFYEAVTASFGAYRHVNLYESAKRRETNSGNIGT